MRQQHGMRPAPLIAESPQGKTLEWLAYASSISPAALAAATTAPPANPTPTQEFILEVMTAEWQPADRIAEAAVLDPSNTRTELRHMVDSGLVERAKLDGRGRTKVFFRRAR